MFPAWLWGAEEGTLLCGKAIIKFLLPAVSFQRKSPFLPPPLATPQPCTGALIENAAL